MSADSRLRIDVGCEHDSILVEAGPRARTQRRMRMVAEGVACPAALPGKAEAAPERVAAVTATGVCHRDSMTLRVIGAGLPRTGTTSLKTALERLLGQPCYHMIELLQAHLEHAPIWREAMAGSPTDWNTFLGGYAAAVDWPASWMWRELALAYPDALVVLSRRDSAETWYHSMQRTVGKSVPRIAALAQLDPAGATEPSVPEWAAHAPRDVTVALGEVFSRMEVMLQGDPVDVMAGYERHLDEVRAEIPAGRLLDWQPGDGWQPLCAALEVPMPDEPFPHENTSQEFQARVIQSFDESP
jgi:hypothetical protein